MKKIFYAIFALVACLTLTQCNPNDYLNVSSPDKSDDVFVTSTVSETFKTLSYCYGSFKGIAGGGNYNWNDSASDCEYYPEYNSNNGRIGYLRPKEAGADNKAGQFNTLFKIAGRCALIGQILGEKEEVKSALAAGTVNDWTQLYGEAWTFWAFAYMELVRHYGDVPYGIENSVVEEYSLTSRFDILDECIKKLKEVEAYMYDLGQGGITAERISRTFANMLIAEANLMAGGYQTLRSDVEGLYGAVTFDTMYTNAEDKAFFARRSDWQSYYTQAQTYFRLVVSGARKGTLRLLTTDDRGKGNPFQRGYQYIMDLQVSPESVFEVGNIQGNGNSERPYSQGRPSNGGNKAAACCKVFSGIRVVPTAYYQIYEDGDLRWDASAVVTGSDGKGSEMLVTLKAGNKCDGGIAINKWDINKMNPPFVTQCRRSGMNYVFFRMDNTMLKLAEVDIALGDNEAKTLINQLRNRAGLADLPSVTVDDLIAEVKRECLGEGDIKFTEIRTGKFTALAKAMRTELQAVIAGLEADGYYTFANGRTISKYVWTKLVDLSGNGKAQITFNRDDSDPALTPGWRGSYDYTTLEEAAGAVSGTKHNLAIKGLFEYIDPAGAEAAALEADGYKKVNWGQDMINAKSTLYDYNMLSGITLSDVPFYFHPIPRETIDQSKGNVTNGYGLPQV